MCIGDDIDLSSAVIWPDLNGINYSLSYFFYGDQVFLFMLKDDAIRMIAGIHHFTGVAFTAGPHSGILAFAQKLFGKIQSQLHLLLIGSAFNNIRLTEPLLLYRRVQKLL